MTSCIELNCNDALYCFEYPEPVKQKSGIHGTLLSKKDLFLMIARDFEDEDPRRAAFNREVASYFQDFDRSGVAIDRDGNGAMLVDHDDWDELSDEQKKFCGNRNATIALFDRLRFDLEMMADDPSKMVEVDEIRRALNEIVASRSLF